MNINRGEKMSEEEFLRKLEIAKKEREQRYNQLKGQIQGFRLMKPNPQANAIVAIYEMMIDESHTIWNELYRSVKRQISTNQKISNLETKVSEIEKNVTQLRQTLDRMYQDR